MRRLAPLKARLRHGTAVQRRGQLSIALTGGRSSVSGVVATVFGCTGFLGRYVVNQFGRVGSQVVIPFRGEENSYTHLKIMGDLGQIVPMRWDIRDKDSIREAMKHSNVVINLVGQMWDTRNFTMSDVNIEGARRIAEVANELNVARYIHVSCLTVNTPSESDYVRTKLEGEKAVRVTNPRTTILRPSIYWGAQDSFLMTRAAMSLRKEFPLIHPDRQYAPVFVNDVATAILSAVRSHDSIGQTYELEGPEVFTERQFSEWVAKMIKVKPRFYVPSEADAWNYCYWNGLGRFPWWTLDSLNQHQDVRASGEYPGFEQLNIPRQPLRSQLAVSYIMHNRIPTRQFEIEQEDEPEEIKELQRAQPYSPII